MATDEPIVLAESQYKFGLGPILMTHLEVLAEVEFDGQPWLCVRAQVANGTPERHSGWSTRDLYIVGGTWQYPSAPRQTHDE